MLLFEGQVNLQSVLKKMGGGGGGGGGGEPPKQERHVEI